MAIGAVILSFSTAIFGSLYLAMIHDLSTIQSMGLYVLLGLLVMLGYTLANGLTSKKPD